MKPALRRLPFLLSTGLFVAAAPAWSADDQSDQALKPNLTTHRYQQEDVQWAGTSVTVIEQAEIEATFRRTLEDLEGYVPGMVIDPISGAPQGAAIGIRGIHTDHTSKGFEPAVAVHVDGVYVGTHAAQNLYLFDFERVEIARGPQGTYTGAPAEAGSINLIRTRPTGELGLKTRLSAGDFNGNDLDAVLNFPIAETLSGKFTANHQKRDGADLKNVVSDRREYGIDRTAYALSLLWAARDNVSVQYTIDLDRDDSDTPGLLNFSRTTDLVCVPDPAVPTSQANCGSVLDNRLPESGNQQRFLQNFSNAREFEADNQILRFEADYKDHQITSITGFRSTKEQFSQDFDATRVDKLSSRFESDYDQFTTDLRISGQYSDNVSYLFGGYFLKSEYDLTRRDLFLLDTLATANRFLPLPAAGQTLQSASDQESMTLSAFGQASYRWDDQWVFDMGLRFNRYEKDFGHVISGVTRTPASVAALLPATDVIIEGDREYNEVAGHLGFTYKVDEFAMVYGRYSVDHTPGGFSDRALSVLSAAPYETSTNQGIELGMKSHWMDNRLRLNFAFYNNYQQDKVAPFADRLSNGRIEYRHDNIADIDVRGFDFEFEFAATDRLYFRGAFGHISADYTRFDVTDLTTPGGIIDRQLEPERAPANTLYLNGQYALPFGPGAFHFFAGYQYFDEYRTNPDVAIGNVRTYSTWDASIEYAWDNYKVRLFSQNINDKRFLLNADRFYDAEFVSLVSTFTDVQGIATVADVNRPRYTGIEFVWTPEL